MRAPDRLPRRGTSRSVHPLLALLVALSVGIVVSTSLSPVASADPPPGQTGPWLETNPTQGRAADPFAAKYWFVVPPTRAGCPYATVDFFWDSGVTPVATRTIDQTTCTATVSFAQPPSTELYGHTLSATACYVDPTGSTVCDSASTAQASYFIQPTPSLVVAPTSGLATAPFKATYNSGDGSCSSFATVQFYWDGKPLAQTPFTNANCVATMDFGQAPTPNGVGRHVVSAEFCPDGCVRPNSKASANYTITAPKPTPTPIVGPVSRPTPRPTPTPAPTPRPTPRPTTAPAAAPTPTPVPSADPATAPSASPAPTGAVLGETSPPQTPSPAPAIAVVIPSASPPADNSFVPAIVNLIGGPTAGAIDPAVVMTNVLLTIVVVFFFGLTAEIFNSTLDANREQIHGWWTRLFGRPLSVVAPLAGGAAIGRLSGSDRTGTIVRAVVVLSLMGLIYGFLSPDFGLNGKSLVLFISLVVGLGFLTYFSEGSTTRLATRRYRADASVRLYGSAVIVAIIAVAISRMVSFQPGLVYGFIASAVVVAPVALAKRDDAVLVLVPAIGLLIVSVLAWLLLGPVKAAAADGSFAPALAQTILAMIVIGGLEGLFITMLPLRFMDGAMVMNWSRLAWALMFGMVTFLWWQLLLNQNNSYVAAFQQTNVQAVLAVLVVFMVTTGGLWTYFRFRATPGDVLEI